MAAGFDTATVVEVLVASGLIAGVREAVVWLTTGRKRQKIDNAQVVQGMALSLLKPVHDELDLCQAKVSQLSAELDSVLAYAIVCHAILDTPAMVEALHSAGITRPSAPETVLKRAVL